MTKIHDRAFESLYLRSVIDKLATRMSNQEVKNARMGAGLMLVDGMEVQVQVVLVREEEHIESMTLIQDDIYVTGKEEDEFETDL